MTSSSNTPLDATMHDARWAAEMFRDDDTTLDHRRLHPLEAQLDATLVRVTATEAQVALLRHHELVPDRNAHLASCGQISSQSRSSFKGRTAPQPQQPLGARSGISPGTWRAARAADASC
jgi:hypothetical protein